MSEGENLKVSVNQLVRFKVIIIFAKWIDDQLSHLQNRNRNWTSKQWEKKLHASVLQHAFLHAAVIFSKHLSLLFPTDGSGASNWSPDNLEGL